MEDRIEAAIRQAVEKTMQELGVEAFRATSWFQSNNGRVAQ